MLQYIFLAVLHGLLFKMVAPQQYSLLFSFQLHREAETGLFIIRTTNFVDHVACRFFGNADASSKCYLWNCDLYYPQDEGVRRFPYKIVTRGDYPGQALFLRNLICHFSTCENVMV